MEKELKTVVGEITNYIFESDDSMYKVLKLSTDDGEITVTGSFPHLEIGLSYEFNGYFRDTKYGNQLQAISYSKSDSYTMDGLVFYLSSDKFKGIGEKTAKNIVETLGLNCIDIILNNPERLSEVKGLNKAKAEIISEAINHNYLEEQVFIKLYSLGLTSKMVERLYEIYGVKAHNVIIENPYKLIDDVEGYGFKRSDQLALNLGFKIDDIRRIKAAILYTINQICYTYGFTFLTANQLIKSTKGLLDNNSIKDEIYDNALAELIDKNKLIFEDDRIYDYKLYQNEVKCKDKLIKLYKGKGENYSRDKVDKILREVESSLSITYTSLQREAIISALTNKLSIITGGPGTGKSTILRGILNVYASLNNLSIVDRELDYKVLLVSPTGRAAKRMCETTSFKASTVHKALGYNMNLGFTKDEMDPITASLIIVDEASMLDLPLATSLFSALLPSARFILVGDSNQLPSVGPGNMLSDLINSSIFKTIRLNQIMRQAKDSNIIKLSSMVLQRKIDYRIFSERNEAYFYPTDSKDLIDFIFKLLDNFIEKGGDLDKGIQILAPMYNGVAGIDEINRRIQERYNKSDKILIRENKLFKKGDKVLQLKNDSELDIMNGDIGKILDITKEDEKDVLMINFDDRILKYPASNLDNLSLAYAISIHKSQGSEFENVIMPILKSYNIMLKPKIIYTGITRAKKKIIVIGQTDAFDQAIRNQDSIRQTTLTLRIEDDLKIRSVVKILDPNIPFDTLGEYDMEGITPYTFLN